MQYLKAFPKLETLRLSGPEITDAEMKYVEELPQLQLFSLSRTSVTDAGVAHVKALSQLHWLGFVAISLTDAGLTHLKGLTKLECVLFHCTDVTDAGVAELPAFTTRLPHRRRYRLAIATGQATGGVKGGSSRYGGVAIRLLPCLDSFRPFGPSLARKGKSSSTASILTLSIFRSGGPDSLPIGAAKPQEVACRARDLLCLRHPDSRAIGATRGARRNAQMTTG